MYNGTGEYFAPSGLGGLGAVVQRESPDVLRLKAALAAWGATPSAPVVMQQLYGATMLWAAKTRPRWTPLDTALAAALQQWAAEPASAVRQGALAGAAARWTAGKHAMGGMGEYFAPVAGLGADAVAACSPECAAALGAEHKTQLAILIPVGIATGLLVGMYVFR